jgi:hypothetical protein
MSVYRQIRNQSEDVLTDLNEDNFDRAFDILRPGASEPPFPHAAGCWILTTKSVIQGTADVGKELTEDELDKTMDFCRRG